MFPEWENMKAIFMNKLSETKIIKLTIGNNNNNNKKMSKT